MNMESMRVRSYRSIAADQHVLEEEAERYRTLKAYETLRAAGCSAAGAEVDPSPPCPAAGLEAQGRQGGDGRAPQIPVHGQAVADEGLSRLLE